MKTGKDFFFCIWRERCVKFDEKTEKHIDSSINSAGALCVPVAVLCIYAADLVWQKGISLMFAVPQKCWKHPADLASW